MHGAKKRAPFIETAAAEGMHRSDGSIEQSLMQCLGALIQRNGHSIAAPKCWEDGCDRGLRNGGQPTLGSVTEVQ